MRSVYLRQTAEADLSLDLQLNKLPLWRRMTPLQKAVLSAYVRASQHNPKGFAALREAEAPIYFASAFGEVGAMLRLTDSIEENSLPVSPKDFQHSVLNAAIAYICMHQGSHQPGLAVSGGYASVDLALHLAARRIAGGLDEAAVVVHAHEWVESEDRARAELIVLSAQPAHAVWQLHSIQQSRTDGETIALDYDERAADREVPWFLTEGKASLSRRVATSHGTLYALEWRELG